MTPEQREVLLMLIEDLTDKGYRLALFSDCDRAESCLSLLLDPKVSEAMAVMVDLKSRTCELHIFLPFGRSMRFVGFVALDFSKPAHQLIGLFTSKLVSSLDRALDLEGRLLETSKLKADHT